MKCFVCVIAVQMVMVLITNANAQKSQCNDKAGYDYLDYSKSCLKGFLNHYEMKTYEEAKTICSNDGGHLVVLDTVEKEVFVRGYISNKYGDNNKVEDNDNGDDSGEGDSNYDYNGNNENTNDSDFWIGLQRQGGAEDNFVWVTGKHVSDTYNSLKDGMVYDADYAYDCVSIDKEHGGWNQQFCSDTRTFVCEI